MTTENQPSVTEWINGAKEGSPEAVEALWRRYFDQLILLARQRLASQPKQASDEEDLALSVFASFCRAAREGRLPDLADRTGLWRVLLTITSQKAIDKARRDGRAKRGGGRVHRESAFDHPAVIGRSRALEQVVGSSPTPEFVAMMADQCAHLLGLLNDDLRQVAVAKMEDYTNPEIAERLDCSVSTVERSLRLIRKIWQNEMAE